MGSVYFQVVYGATALSPLAFYRGEWWACINSLEEINSTTAAFLLQNQGHLGSAPVLTALSWDLSCHMTPLSVEFAKHLW